MSSTLGADPGLGYGPPVRTQQFTRLVDGTSSAAEAAVAEEVPAAFIYNGIPHVVMMCSPADFEDLAYGFTLTEEIVSAAADIGSVEVVKHSRGVELKIEIPTAAAAKLANRARALVGRTGCGLCGVEAIDDAVRPSRRVESDLRIRQRALWLAGAALGEQQTINNETHAVHGAAWATPDGMLQVVREDIGRHNALDKVIGALARAHTDASAGFAIITSRASFELVQKVAATGISILAAVSRPSGLAIRVAEQSNVTLAALLRGESVNLYAHPERIE